MWNELANIAHVFLGGNRLQSLPSSVATVSLERTVFSLGRNPWKCSCDASWMSSWLKSVNSSLLAPDDITCYYPPELQNRNIMSLSSDAFCGHADAESETVKSETVEKVLTIGLPLVVGVMIILLSTGIVVVYRMRIKVYAKWKFHPFDRDECFGEDMDCDVSFCCSSENRDPQGRRIIEAMNRNGCLVCSCQHSALTPDVVFENAEPLVTRSKRTVCLLTANFIRSDDCMSELEMALKHRISRKRSRRLVVLMALDNPRVYDNDASDTAALRQYLRQYTYIDYRRNDWLDRLLYALPIHGMDPQRRRYDDNELLLVSAD